MSNKVLKIISKMLRTKAGHSFEDCEKILLFLDYKVSTQKGSHCTFKHPETKDRITIAKHRPVSKDAINDVLEIWNEHNGGNN